MTGLFNARTAEGPVGNYFSGKQPGTTKVGEKLFSDAFTLKSDIGNPILRQTPIGTDGMAAQPVTWIEKGVLKNARLRPPWAKRQKKDPTPTSINLSLVMEGSDMTVEQMIKTTKRGLLVTFFWYIRAVDHADAAQHRHDARRAVPDRERRDRRPGAELPLEHVAARRLQQHHRSSASPCRCTPASRTTAAARRSCRRCGSKIST